MPSHLPSISHYNHILLMKRYALSPIIKMTLLLKQMWLLCSFHTFSDIVLELAFCNLLSVLPIWCTGELLTSADLRPSRFTWLLSTPRMTAPANYTSVCPLTQRLSCLLSKVRSGSDYNPFPSLLWVSFATSWQQLFHLISHQIATSHTRRAHLCSDPASISCTLFDWAL